MRKQPIIALYFEIETVLKFYNLGARSLLAVLSIFRRSSSLLIVSLSLRNATKPVLIDAIYLNH